MAQAYVVIPDGDFLRCLLDEGGGDLKQCFQCATCSVVCELATGSRPFPRKEMIWAQWGLKDRLLADPDVWRCHQCNDCSTKCPRGARPGDVLAAVGAARFWRAMKSADRAAGRETASLGVLGSCLRVFKSILTHEQFGKCVSQAGRRTAHLGAFYGFVALFVVSAWAVIALYVINPLIPGHGRDLAYPFAIWNPWKLLANLGGIALVGGCLLAIRDRRSGRKDASASGLFDWVFLWLLLTVGATGLLTEALRYVAEAGGASGLVYTAYAVYFVHLVAVFDLLVYLPHSKFAHIVYRTVALVYAEHTGRALASPVEPGRSGAAPTT